MEHNILFELGIVMITGFFSALLMKKLGQSVIIGYMTAGLLIGPNTLGIIKDTGLLGTLSELGIVLLMFFLGLEFSLNKFKRIKNSVFFIGTYEVVFNLALGLFLGYMFGFVFKERFFLAGIIALSSSGVVAKLLFEMKRTASKESEILMGVMVFEDFFAIVLLGVLSSFASSQTIKFDKIGLSALTALLFYGVVILIGVLVINKVIDILTRIESQELFTALMLGLILLIGYAAVKLGLASAAGAFLLGMLIVSYDVEERLHRTVSAFKDIFLIIFFISFGMLLNPREIPSVLPMAAIIVPVTILGELVITSSAAFFSGFSSKSSVSIGASMISRGEYSMIYATLGLSTGAISHSTYQFTGVYVFIMTLAAPIFMKNSVVIKKAFSFIVPDFIKYGLKLVSVTLKPLLLPEELGVRSERTYRFITFFGLYMLGMGLLLYVPSVLKGPFLYSALATVSILAVITAFKLRSLLTSKIVAIEEQINYSGLHEGPYSLDYIIKYISNIFTSLLVIITLGSAFYSFHYLAALILLMVFVLYLLLLSFAAYRGQKNFSRA